MLFRNNRRNIRHVSIEEYEYFQYLYRRELFLYDYVSIDVVSLLITKIRDFNLADIGIPVEKRKPITIYIFSGGGEVNAGLSLIDEITKSKTPIHTVNDGIAASMAGLILIAGHKRFSKEHATLMLHDGSLALEDNTSKTFDFFKYYEKLNEQIADFVVSRSKITLEEYKQNYSKDWYLLPDEAKKKGLIDVIMRKPKTK